jgi:propionyl-CoA synthetase
MSYDEDYHSSLTQPEEFWLSAASAVDWITPPGTALDDERAPMHRWFASGQLNTCANALDRHVEAGAGERAALIWDSPMTGTKRTFTYAQLLDRVARFAGGLSKLGVGKGDRVLIYMPMVPEGVIAMLACARLGAVHSVVFGGFAPRELADRIDDCEPRVVVAASCGIEPSRVVAYQPLLERAIELSRHQPQHIVMLQRDVEPAQLGLGYLDWYDVADAAPAAPVPVAATDPLYILYTSGTTGRPKGVVRDHGGHAVALTYSMRVVYDIGPGDIVWSASDIGWQVGHTCIVYGPLLVGATTVMYEGKPVGTPDAGAFWRVISEHQVTTLITAPTAIRAIKREDPTGALLTPYDLSSLATLFLAGERLDPDTHAWATDTLGVPVVDHWWQTETGWPVASNLRGLQPMPIKPGSPTVPVPGWDVQILGEHGERLPPGEEGAIAIRLPLPPGALMTLWGDDERYVEGYLSEFAGYYSTGDGGHRDDDGYLYVMGRTDDVINVAGHRLSTGSLEAVISSHEAVAECAVIGVRDELKGQLPLGLVVLKTGAEITQQNLRQQLADAVREEVGPVAAFRDVVIVAGLPKTRSGKILRRTMRALADGRDEAPPATIDDASVLDALRPVLRGSGASGSSFDR